MHHARKSKKKANTKKKPAKSSPPPAKALRLTFSYDVKTRAKRAGGAAIWAKAENL